MTSKQSGMLKNAENHGEKKVNFWEAPTNVAAWKEEQVLDRGNFFPSLL